MSTLAILIVCIAAVLIAGQVSANRSRPVTSGAPPSWPELVAGQLVVAYLGDGAQSVKGRVTLLTGDLLQLDHAELISQGISTPLGNATVPAAMVLLLQEPLSDSSAAPTESVRPLARVPQLPARDPARSSAG